MNSTTRSEFSYIEWIRRQGPHPPEVAIGPGDDTAGILLPAGEMTLITTDMLLEGSCFLIKEAGPFRVGRKAMAVNLSDIAAMAGIPRYAVVSLGLPREGGRHIAEQVYLGMRDIADGFRTTIIGGDTNSWNGPLVISVTLIGSATTRGPVKRSGAKPGDWILVTGPLGGSILGKHLDFCPRIAEALQLHQAADIHAMIDISDGLAADLYHLCEESGCGAVLQGDSIPIASAAIELSATSGKSPQEHALSDGEDFELLFSVSASDGARLLEEQPIPGIHLHHIGEMALDGIWLEEGGRKYPLGPLGYTHEIQG